MISDIDSNEVENSALLKYYIEQAAMIWRTTMIGQCMSFNEAKNTCVIQPVLMVKSLGEDPKVAQQLIDVPVKYVCAGGMVLTYKPKKGDYCLLQVCDRSISGWKQQGGIFDPRKRRHHNMNDCVADFGINPYPDAIADIKGGFDIRTRDGSTSFHVIDGEINMEIGGTQVANFSSGLVKFSVPIEAPTGDFDSSLKVAGKELAGHTHSGVQSGGSNTGGNN